MSRSTRNTWYTLYNDLALHLLNKTKQLHIFSNFITAGDTADTEPKDRKFTQKKYNRMAGVRCGAVATHNTINGTGPQAPRRKYATNIK
jgi:hypothetical protein